MVALQAWGSLTVLFGVSLASTEPKSAFPASGAGMLCGKRRKNISARRMACSVPGAVWPPRGSALMGGGALCPACDFSPRSENSHKILQNSLLFSDLLPLRIISFNHYSQV